MTIESTLTKVQYLGNGVTREFPVPYRMTNKEHVHLVLTSPDGNDEDVTRGYTVRTVAGGTAVAIFDRPPLAGWKLTLVRRVPLVQQLDLENGGTFDAENIEGALDFLTMQTQQLAEEVDRAVKVPVSSDESPEDLHAALFAARDTATASAGQASAAAEAVETLTTSAMAAAQEAAASAEIARQIAANGNEDATETIKGIVRLATREEHEDGALGLAAQPVHVAAMVRGEVDALPKFPPVTPDLAGKPLALVPQEDGTFKWQEVGSGVPVGLISWIAADTPPAGYIDLSNDNGLLVRAGWKDLWVEAQRSGLLRPEAEWQAEFAAHGSVGFYSSGDDAITFRAPLLRRVYIRAADPDGGLDVGMWQGDAIRDIVARGVVLRSSPGLDLGAASLEGTQVIGAAGGATLNLNATYSTTPVVDSIRASRVVPTADENRPVTLVLLPIMKTHDTIKAPSELVLEDALQQVVGINNLVNSEVYVRGLAGTRVWTSAEYVPVLATPTIVTHGIENLDQNNARAEVWLKCVVAEAGYVVGDVVRNVGTATAGGTIRGIPSPVILTDTVISTTSGEGNPIVGINKTTGAVAALIAANWRYIFKIWY